MPVLRRTAVAVGLAAGCLLSLVSPATAEVHLRAGAEPEASQVTRQDYGQFGDRHLLCDWDGDGRATVSVYRPSDATWWYLRPSDGLGTEEETFRYGRPGAGDRAFCGDWDGDGDDSPGIFRSSDNIWYLRDSADAGPASATFRYGRPGLGDTPLAGDWDGDGDDSPGIFRSSDNFWYLRNAATAGNANTVFRYGRPGLADTPLTGDWDGDKTDTPGIFRSVDRTLHLRNSNDSGPATWSYPFGAPTDPGAPTDSPFAGDWDADGRDEPALSRDPIVTPAISLDVRRGASAYIFEGAVSPGRSVPVTLARVVGSRLEGVAGTRSAANGAYTFSLPLGPGSYSFRVLSAAGAGLAPGISPTVSFVVPADPTTPPPAPPALPAPPESAHENRKALRVYYPHGIGRVGAVDRTNGTPVTTWTPDAAGYNRAMSFNRSLDGDRDGIACEQRRGRLRAAGHVPG